MSTSPSCDIVFDDVDLRSYNNNNDHENINNSSDGINIIIMYNQYFLQFLLKGSNQVIVPTWMQLRCNQESDSNELNPQSNVIIIQQYLLIIFALFFSKFQSLFNFRKNNNIK